MGGVGVTGKVIGNEIGKEWKKWRTRRKQSWDHSDLVNW